MNNEQFNEKNLPDQPEVAEETTPVAEEVDEVSAEELLDAMTGKKEKKAKKSSRRLRYGGMAVLVTVLVIVGVLVLNILADVLFARFPLSVDMTSDSRFTISAGTQEVIDAIDRPVEIIAFFPESTISTPNGTTTEINTVLKELHQALNEYASKSDGKVTVTYVDLATQPTLLTNYKAYGDIVETDILFRSGEGDDERFRLKSLNDFYTYTTDSYGYYLQSFTSRVEVTLASAVNAVISDTDQELILLTGHNEDSYVTAALTDLYELNGYTVSEINLASNQEIGENVSTAIIAAPTTDLSNAEVTRLRDWLTNDGKLGRNLMVVVNNMATKADCPNLYEFLDDEYQIEVTDNLVMESSADRMVAGYSGQMIYADLPESPVQEDGEKSAAAVAYLPRQILLKAGTDNTQTLYNIPLVTFPESSQLVALPVNENSTTVAADEYPVVGMGMAVKWTYDNSGDESELVSTGVVVANQGMIDSSLFAESSIENERITLDIMNYINGNEDTVSISDKDLTPDSLTFSTGGALALGVILMIALPVILLVICLVVFLRRRHL